MGVVEDLHVKPWVTIWSCRRTGMLGFFAGVILAILLCAVLPSQWDARMTVAPAGRGVGGDLSALLPNPESPAIQYLLQRVGSVTAADFSAYEVLMTSPRVAASLIKDEAFRNKLDALCNKCGKSAAALSRWLDCHVRTKPIGATQMRRVTLRMQDKQLATDLLRALHRISDETIRTDARIRTDQRISYLRDQLSKVSNPDHRDALIGLLKEQERSRMMVGIDQDYAAEAIDPPSISSRRSFPNPYLFVPVFAFVGLLGGLAFGLYKKK